jgi:hypothetical protein
LPRKIPPGSSDKRLRNEILKSYRFKGRHGEQLDPVFVTNEGDVSLSCPFFKGCAILTVTGVLSVLHLPLDATVKIHHDEGSKMVEMHLRYFELVFFVRYIFFHSCWPVKVYKIEPFKLDVHFPNFANYLQTRRPKIATEIQMERLSYIS